MAIADFLAGDFEFPDFFTGGILPPPPPALPAATPAPLRRAAPMLVQIRTTQPSLVK